MPNELIDKLKITTNKTPENPEGTTTTYSSGSIFSRIFYDYKDDQNNDKISTYTLANFFEAVQKFFLAPMHMIYQENIEPNDFNIKEWYKIETRSSN